MSIIQNSFNLFIPIFIIAFGAILLTTTLKKYLPPSVSWLSIFLMMTGSSLLILHLAPVQKTPHWYFFFSLIYLGVFFYLLKQFYISSINLFFQIEFYSG
jgi:hypothetical protein